MIIFLVFFGDIAVTVNSFIGFNRELSEFSALLEQKKAEIMQDGCLNAEVKGASGVVISDLTGYTFTWSKDGTEITDPDGQQGLLPNGGQSVNVALTKGGLATYTLTVANGSGTVGTATYTVPYDMHQVEDGTYYLVETKAPTGYSLPTGAFTVTVGTTAAGSSTITNTSNIFLPGTGGAGTVLFTVGGIAILLGAGAFLFLNRKRLFGE